jgi:exosortase A
MMDADIKAAWLKTVFLLTLSLLTVIALLQPTFMSMVEIWERSETFTHGYVILPIALWLVWRNRATLASTPVNTDWRALALLIPLALGWLAARAGGVLVVEQYALVSILIGMVWLLLGQRQLRALAFPLAFLLLMVPNGEGLIPPMMEFTADFTVGVIQLIGIPVYREGLFFSLPSGDWSVVEGCSGLRYLIASITLGTLYAYLTYRSSWKRVAFVLAAIIVPIIANGIRATLIVLLAHYSDMKLALGVDHFIYGWVWFGIVMLAMFWVGLIWREDIDVASPASVNTSVNTSADTSAVTVKPAQAVPAAITSIALIALIPIYETHLNDRVIETPHLSAPSPALGWLREEREEREKTTFSSWEPHWVGMDQKLLALYRKDDRQVMLFVAWYGAQGQGSELINSQNFMVAQKHPEWRNLHHVVKTSAIAGQSIPMAESTLAGNIGPQRMLVWQWHRIDGKDGINPYRAKIELAFGKLLGQTDDAAAIIVATPYIDDATTATATLTDFLSLHKAELDQQLDTISMQ